jgi:N-acetylglucosamine-6-phosphate deacetylase
MLTALVNGRVLTDAGFVTGHAVLLEGSQILDVVRDDDARCKFAAQRDLGGRLLLPGFIDTQVNGGGGVLFNDDPSVEAIRAIGAAHRRFGTTGFLPTLISDDLEVVARAVAAVQAAINAGVPGVLGIHIEGPFINVERKGVHDPAKLRELDDSAVGLLTSLKNGKTLVTLAPEMTTPRERGRGGVGRAFERYIRAGRRSARQRPHRVHAPVQRHVATHGARARCRRRCAGRPR